MWLSIRNEDAIEVQLENGLEKVIMQTPKGVRVEAKASQMQVAKVVPPLEGLL